jgi:hypothetical protein
MKEAQKLTDPDPEHCLPVCVFIQLHENGTFMRLWKHGQSYLDLSYDLIASYATVHTS